MDGFDRYRTSGNVATALSKKYSVSNQGSGITVASGRYGGYGLSMGRDSKCGESRIVIPALNSFPGTSQVIGFNFYSVSGGLLQFTTPTANYYGVNAMGIAFGNGQVILGVTVQTNFINALVTASVANNAWHHVELKATSTATYNNNGTVGHTCNCQLYVNGSLVGSASAPWNTAIANYGGINSTGIGSYLQSATVIIDDFYVIDDVAARSEPVDRIGSTARVTTLFPSAAKNGTDVWTPTNAVNAFTAVKQVPIGTAYITAPSSNSVQEFEFDDLPTSVTDVKGLQLNTMASGDTIATYKHMVNNTAVLTTTLTTTSTLRTTPLTVVDKTAVNAIQAGVSS